MVPNALQHKLDPFLVLLHHVEYKMSYTRDVNQ
jgi:hypothetical protein